MTLPLSNSQQSVRAVINQTLLSRDLGTFLHITQRAQFAQDLGSTLYWLRRDGKVEPREFLEVMLRKVMRVSLTPTPTCISR